MMDKKALMRLIKELEYSLDYYKRDFKIYGRSRDIETIEYLENQIKEYRSKIED